MGAIGAESTAPGAFPGNQSAATPAGSPDTLEGLGVLPARRASPGGAALRSALFPGWGQLAAGRQWRGWALVGGSATILLLLLAAVLALVIPFLRLPPAIGQTVSVIGDVPLRVLDWLLASDWNTLWKAAIALNVAVFFARVWAAVDAAMCARRGARARQQALLARGVRPLPLAGGAAPAVFAILALVVPHATAMAAGLAILPYLNQVLVADKPLPAAVAASPAAAGPAQPNIFDADLGRPVWNGESRLNVLLMGTDRRPQEVSQNPRGNSDTLLLVSIDPATRAAAMVSIPRDLVVPLPGIGPEKINAAYREGGPDLSVRVVADLLGQPVHRWASIDVSAFARVVDELGGVVIDVEHPIRDDEYPVEDYSIRRVYIPSGLQWLTGEQALWYARTRHGSTDFDRAARQQALLLSLKDRARDRRMVPRIPALIGSLADAVQSDIAPREALALVRLGGNTDFRSARLVLTPPLYGREIIRPDLYAIEPNVARIRAAVAETLSGAPAPPARDDLASLTGGAGVPAQGSGAADATSVPFEDIP